MHALESAFGRKRVLVTGHTGFKGGWLAAWLLDLGAQVWGLALPAHDPRSVFERTSLARELTHLEGDIRDLARVDAALEVARPDYVFHLAAQALVRRSYDEPLETVATNVLGTAHILDALRRHGRPCVAVIVTSDKCYDPTTGSRDHVETDPLGGRDIYSATKACAELLARAWESSFFSHGGVVRIATTRAGNVIGPGDWSRHRIVPDSITALQASEPIRVRNPDAIRPWQHVLEPLAGYLLLAKELATTGRGSGAWNFGPAEEAHVPVRDLVSHLIAAWGSGDWVDASDPAAPREEATLRLSIGKAAKELGWRPVWPLRVGVERLVRGYRELMARTAPDAARRFLSNEIADYTLDAARCKLAWAQPECAP